MPKTGIRLKEFPKLVIDVNTKVYALLTSKDSKDKEKAIKTIKELIK